MLGVYWKITPPPPPSPPRGISANVILGKNMKREKRKKGTCEGIRRKDKR
jgi:hypothetical protein